MGELPRRVELWIGGQGAEGLALDDLEAQRIVSWADIDAALSRWRGFHRVAA